MKALRTILFLLSILLMPLLAACGGQSSELPPITVPEELSQQAAVASTRAAEVAATAQVVAATVAAQNGDLAATAQAGAEQLPGTATGSLRERFSGVQPDAEGNLTVVVTDAEVTQAIQEQQAAAAQAGTQIPIQNSQVAFTGGNIVLSGQITEPISSQLAVTFRPSVVDGVLQFEILSASLGSIEVPAALLSNATSMLNSTLGEAMNNLPANVVLREIQMGEGTMTVIGSRA